MLRAPKKQEHLQIAATHEELFTDNYELLLRWALKFTDANREIAEDLLHDTFIHFTLTRPDLASIENLDGYLYVVMRNLHLSQMRKATRTPGRAMSVVEFDTVDVGMWASDPRDRLRMRDELAAVCQYACIRKETSKVGSVLILRFFHGYYPEEIAGVLGSTRAVAHERLRNARAEAKEFLENPDRFSNGQHKVIKLKAVGNSSELRAELRRQIFGSCQGEHAKDLDDVYRKDRPKTPQLAHIVSCPSCIEAVNSLLDLPSLASRYPLDTVGKDPGSRKRGDGPGGNGAGGAGVLDTFYERRDAHYHHEPSELCIAVNGQLQGFQKVVSGKGELTLILDNPEPLGFVEVFSEQGLRLLMLNVEPPPVGAGRQSARVRLSSGRTVDANLNFSGVHPALQVSYSDPELTAAAAEVIESPNLADAGATIGTVSGPSQLVVGSLLDKFRFWINPGRLTVGFATLLILALVWIKLGPTTAVSAAEILNKSAEAEASRLTNPERVLHRTIDLEELDANGQVMNRKRIDIWQGGDKGITARRLYDEQGRLAAGDWRNASGIQTVYQRGQAAKLQPIPEKRTFRFEDTWQLSLTAKEFLALVEENAATIEERANDHFISYTPHQPGGQAVKATITLSKEDLHAIEQTFTLRNGTETRDFRMVESAYDWRPANTVAPEVFEPNVELTGDNTKKLAATDAGVTATTESSANTNTNATTAAPPAAMATAALEVEVIEALNNAGAFTGEQIDVTRTGDGKINVTALVETATRKQVLMSALNNVRSNPAVRLSIETVAEAEARIRKQRTQSQPNLSLQQVEVSENSNPVYAELRRRFSDEEARRFADRVLSRSRSVRAAALAMRQLSGRFSAADLQPLTPAERGKWLALIRGHANMFIAEAEALRREVQPIFSESAAGGTGVVGSISSDAELQTRTLDLYEAAVTIDRGLGRSFAISAGSSDGPVTTSSFWLQFAQAVGMARSIAAAK